jgi:membrane-associated HD superfamily phosphohydrolase
MRYSFTLKDNNQKAYNQFTWFLFFLHIVAAAVFILNSNDPATRLKIYILLGFYALLSIVYFMYRKHQKAFETFSLILALLYANFWFQHVGILAVIAFAAVYIMVTLVKGKRTTVLFSAEGIHLTRVFKTIIFPWPEIENAILKDNLLTIDFKTNKIIQVEIIENAKAVDETEFNLFCTDQLSHKA